jgi:AbiV family abortive infection protein
MIDDLIDALLRNATNLIAESVILRENGHFARAFALAHLAREELAKGMMLSAAGFKVLFDTPVDWKKLNKRFRNHEEKLILEGVQAAAHVGALGHSTHSNVILKHAAAMARHRNKLKNTSLYVEIDEGKVSQPAEAVTEEQSNRTWKLAQIALQDQAAMRRQMGRFDQLKSSEFKGLLPANFENQVRADPIEAMKFLINAQIALWAKVTETQGEA